MNKYKLVFTLLLVCLFLPKLKAQRPTDLVINEVMTNNQNNYMDPIGQRPAWIEIYNKSAAEVNIAGCFLTNSRDNKKMYLIRKGDVHTKIGPHQRLMIFCNSLSHNSAFHTNFTLEADEENYVALISANGITVIDEVMIPILDFDQTYGAEIDGKKDTRKILTVATPNASNYEEKGSTSVEKFKNQDPFGIGMALTAMMVVFTALLCLFICFKIIGRISIQLTNARSRKAAGLPKGTKIENPEISGEVYAAIAMALQLHEDDAHDYEDTVLTMKTVEKPYSPWSSKIYGLRELPQRK